MNVKPGEKFSIAGVGYDADGWLIVNGHRIDGKPSKAVKDHVWTMGDVSPLDSLPARVSRETLSPRLTR